LTKRRVLAATTALLVAGAAAPSLALAHGLVGKQDLPIPRWLFTWAAAVVLVVSFLGLAVLWPRPRLEKGDERRVLGVARAVEVLCGAVGVALFALVVYAGFAGTQTATANLAPTFVYVLFWVGLVILSLLFGDVFRALNPWRAVARGAGWVAARVGGSGALPDPLPYPERLGRWPAALGILAFAWLELAYSGRDDPSALAVLALVYAAVQLVGMSLFGVECWTDRGDAFSVYFGLFARLSPLHWHGRALHVRMPLTGATRLDIVPGTVAVLCVMIGTTSFDGLTQGRAWASVVPDLQRVFTDLGLGQIGALEAAYTVGLVLAVLVVTAVYRLGVTGMRSVGGSATGSRLGCRFAHTLVPIAMAYVVAHYFSLLAYQGQATAYLASDPLGRGSDLLGTASKTIDYGVISANGVWYVQVGALVAGHVAGLVLAHDRALLVYDRVRDATRSQYWMLAVMVAFTSLGLWLLSAAAQG
jgi:hypothetical protein